MVVILVGFAIALVITMLLVKATSGLGGILLDGDVSGPQKFHARPVPRVGGIGILIGLACAFGVIWLRLGESAVLVFSLFLCCLPAFGAGIVEDLTKRVSPAIRLLATIIAALAAIAFLDAAIYRTEIPGLDWLVGLTVGRIVVTTLAVAGIAHSVNIIDGFNGLASMCVMIILAALAYVAFQVGDTLIGLSTLALIGAVFGFFVWNFPGGLIFLGDGGAYLLGFLVAELSILLLLRNISVSPIFPLLLCIYPVFETLFTVYRRRFLRSMPPSSPDGIHLHSLIYRRVLIWAVGSRSAKDLTRRNSMTSPYLWALCMLSVVPAVLFWDSTITLALFLGLFGLTYVLLYWRIVRFKSPRWLRFRPSSPHLMAKADNPQS